MFISYAEDLFPPLSLLESFRLPLYIQEHHSIIHSIFPLSILRCYLMPIMPSPISIRSLPIDFQIEHSLFLWRLRSRQRIPHVPDTSTTSRQHAVLKAVQILAVNWWHEFACCETGEHMRRKVVLANAVAELEVLVEHCRECEGNGLEAC